MVEDNEKKEVDEEGISINNTTHTTENNKEERLSVYDAQEDLEKLSTKREMYHKYYLNTPSSRPK